MLRINALCFLWRNKVQMKTVFCFLFIGIFNNAWSQTPSDSLLNVANKADSIVANVKKAIAKDTVKLDPHKVTIHSALIPGWGQLDVKQWWLVPAIYGGFGFAGFSIQYNSSRYRTFVGAYVNLVKNSKSDTTMLGRRFTVDQLRIIKDGYRRNREMSYFSVLGIWALQIIEANVAAHLKTFDVSEDLSLKISPNFSPAFGSTTVGVKLELTLGKQKAKKRANNLLVFR